MASHVPGPCLHEHTCACAALALVSGLWTFSLPYSTVRPQRAGQQISESKEYMVSVGIATAAGEVEEQGNGRRAFWLVVLLHYLLLQEWEEGCTAECRSDLASHWSRGSRLPEGHKARALSVLSSASISSPWGWWNFTGKWQWHSGTTSWQEIRACSWMFMHETKCLDIVDLHQSTPGKDLVRDAVVV